MRKLGFASVALSLVLAGCATPAPTAVDKTAPFPEAKEGFERHIIWLHEEENERAREVEVLAGKTMEVDCNIHWFSGELTQATVEGWGYNYFELNEVVGPMSTMKACPNGNKMKAFVPVNGSGFKLTYNSRLPVVVYAPEGVEVRFRIWEAGQEIKAAIKE